MNTITCDLCGTEYSAGLASCPSCGIGTSPEVNLPMGTELHGGKFTVGKVLGRGGFGITYKGAHRELQRPVAIKELFPEFAQRSGLHVTVTASRREEFQHQRDSVVQEARRNANLDSRNIVDVHDFFRENGTVYIVMEYVDGPTLEQEIERQGRLSAEKVVNVAEQVCDALETIHGANLLHKDIKPANILLAPDGRAVLIDFGAAREYEMGKTQHYSRIMTRDYGAPELWSQAARFGPYTDLFCLGATLYHALEGEPPPPAMDRLQAADQTVTLPSAVPDGLRKAVQGALNCRTEDRPQSVAEFRAFLGVLPTEQASQGQVLQKPQSVQSLKTPNRDTTAPPTRPPSVPTPPQYSPMPAARTVVDKTSHGGGTFLSKLRGWLSGKSNSGRFLEIYALNFRCQEPLSARIDMYNDPSPVDEGSEVKGAAYYVRKVVSTSGDQRCFDSCEIQVWLNSRRQEVNREIAGGKFLSAEEYTEAQAEFQRWLQSSD